MTQSRDEIRAAAKCFFLAVLIASCVAAVGPAVALTPRDLAGWWLAIDGVFPSLWDKSGPREELLVVRPDGAIENRAMHFRNVSASECEKSKLCSDAPPIARGRLTIARDKIEFTALSPERAESFDPALATAAVSAKLVWEVELSHDNRLMTLRAGGRSRVFARIEADRLRRLRAGMMTAALPADKHWRCFLANATLDDVAFGALRKGKHTAPAWLIDYLRIASYRLALLTMGAQPTADDPDIGRRTLVSVPVETLLIEEFKEISPPRSRADARRYRAQGAFIDQRARGVSPQEANVVATALNGGKPVTVTATAAEYAALMRVTARDAEVRRLFCME